MNSNDTSRFIITKVLEKKKEDLRIIAKQLVDILISHEVNPAEVSSHLMIIIQEMNKFMIQKDYEQLTSLVEFSEIISKSLRIFTQQNDTLKYYYFGQFQSDVNKYSEILDEVKNSSKWREHLSRKHVKEILIILFELEECRQSDLADILKIDRSNLSRTMQKLIDAEIVEENKLNKFCYYSLSPEAKRLCNHEKEIYSRIADKNLFKWYYSKPAANLLIDAAEETDETDDKNNSFVRWEDDYLECNDYADYFKSFDNSANAEYMKSNTA